MDDIASARASGNPPRRLTKRVIDSLKPRAKPYYAYDGELPGFALRVPPSGFQSFLFEYRPRDASGRAGRHVLKKRVTIAPYGLMTPDQARAAAMALLLKV